MGRDAGWIALTSGIAGGTDVILVPEVPDRYRGDLPANQVSAGTREKVLDRGGGGGGQGSRVGARVYGWDFCGLVWACAAERDWPEALAEGD